jgi:hypothetical protein
LAPKLGQHKPFRAAGWQPTHVTQEVTVGGLGRHQFTVKDFVKHVSWARLLELLSSRGVGKGLTERPQGNAWTPQLAPIRQSWLNKLIKQTTHESRLVQLQHTCPAE